jgi:hypothetical protein
MRWEKSRKALLFAYLWFAIFPHVQSVTHSHSGGGLPHSHSDLSSYDAGLKLSIVEALDKAGTKIDPVLPRPPAEAPQASTAPADALERSARGFKTGGPVLHTHFLEDPNLLGLGVAWIFALLFFAWLRLPIFPLPAIPILPAVRPAVRLWFSSAPSPL